MSPEKRKVSGAPGAAQPAKRRKTSDRGVATADPIKTILGLDFGSSGTRATLLHTDTLSNRQPMFHNVVYVENDASGSQESLFNWQRFDFIAGIDPASNLVGPEAIKRGKKPIGLKFYIYELARVQYAANADASMAIENELKDSVPDEIKDSGIDHEYTHLDQIRNLLVSYFQKVRAKIDAHCITSNCSYDKMAVTIPATWDGHLQQTYSSILDEVWTQEIIFVYEAEGIGHYMLSAVDHPQFKNVQADMLDGGFDKIMFIDFGGHTVSGASFILCKRSDDEAPHFAPAFYSDAPAWGCAGGIEYYAFVVEQELRSDPDIAKLPNEEREATVHAFMGDFRYKQHKFRGHWSKLRCDSGDWKPAERANDLEVPNATGGVAEVPENGEKESPGSRQGSNESPSVRRLFDRAFREPLDYIKRKIEKEVKDGRSTLVVLSGGSFFNHSALKEIKDFVNSYEDQGWKLHTVLHDNYITLPGLIIAQGAALAVANQMSVADFMSQGAAFGIQGGKNTSIAKIIMDRGKAASAWIRVTTENHPPKIICNPFAKAPTSPDSEERAAGKTRPIGYKSAYDFVEFPTRQPGQYRYEMRMVDRKVELRETRRVEGTDFEKRWMLPVYFDPGQRVLMVNRDEFDEKNLWR